MAKLHYISPLLELPEKIAVVGSSGRLLDENYGSLIDSFDVVVRFNRAPTENFEKFVGSKTDIYWMNRHVILGSKLTKKDLEERKSGFWAGQKQEFVEEIRDKKIISYLIQKELDEIYEISKLDKSNKVFSYNQDLFEKDFKISNITSGTSFIYVCVVSKIEPHLFGFDVVEDDRSRDHYWEKRPGVSSVHNMTEEKTRIRNFIKQNKVVLYK